MMEQFINAVRQSIATENWYAALGMALTLPDICGRLTDPEIPSGKRYAAWWEEYVQERYTVPDHVFLSGRDAYALRCAYLHEGRDDVAEQRAREALSSFVFVAPRPGWNVHCNQRDDILQLQVNIFCGDVCDGATAWMESHRDDEAVQERLRGLIEIHSLLGDFAF